MGSGALVLQTAEISDALLNVPGRRLQAACLVLGMCTAIFCP